MTPIERAPAQWTTRHRQESIPAAPFGSRPNTVSPPTSTHIPKPYSDIVNRGNKRNSTDPDDGVPKRRRTKKDALREETLMNTASEKLESLTAENVQLKLRLEQASREATKLKLTLEKERQVSSERDASNQALRLLLLEERTKAELRSTNVSSSYDTIDTMRPYLPPLPAMPSHQQSERPRSFHPQVSVVLELQRLQRGGTTNGDLSTALRENHHSQMVVKHLREELASIVDRGNELASLLD